MNTPEVIQLGNPKLRLISQPVEEVEFASKELREIVDALFHIMEEKGGVGVAAPQIGVNKRIIVFGLQADPAYPQLQPIPYTALINPTLDILDEEMAEEYEGCLSVGTIRGKVSRYTRVRYRGVDSNGLPVAREVQGLHARVVQHECDHLDGIIFLDRVSNYASLGFHEELVVAGQMKKRRTE